MVNAVKGKSKVAKKVVLGPRADTEDVSGVDKDGQLRKKAVDSSGGEEEGLEHLAEPGLVNEMDAEAKAVRVAQEVQKKNKAMAEDMEILRRSEEALRTELIVLRQNAAREERRKAAVQKVKKLKEVVDKKRANERWVLEGELGESSSRPKVGRDRDSRDRSKDSRDSSRRSSLSTHRGSPGKRSRSRGSVGEDRGRRSRRRAATPPPRRRSRSREGRRRTRTRSKSPGGRRRRTRSKSPRRGRSPSRGRADSDASTRRLAGEVAQLRRQVALESVRTPWSKAGHQRQYEVLQKLRGTFVTDLSKVLEKVFGSAEDIPVDIKTVCSAGEKLVADREKH